MTDALDSNQKRILTVLSIAQIFGGVGVASGAAVGALLASDLQSEAFSGFASAAWVVGAAIIAIPVTRLMDRRGRRPGLLLAYGFGVIGALTIVLAAKAGIFPLALLGMMLTGGGTTATLQSRYAATDLAEPHRRGRSLSTVVWATTLGSVLGPNLAGPMGDLAEHISVPRLAGPYLLTIVVFGVAAAILTIFLRPDPLLTARDLQHARVDYVPVRQAERSMKEAIKIIRGIPIAAAGLAAVMLGQAVMTSVMSMTPVHLHDADASLNIIGVVISLHIFGMYAASPLVGWACDHYGRKPVILTGCMILLAAFVTAGTASGHQTVQLTAGLFMLGLGWSCTMIGGSTLLTDSVPLEQRANVQGTADVLMGFGGAAAGLSAGVVVGLGSYALLNLLAACLIIGLLFMVIAPARSPLVQQQAGD
ncbi:MAG TPA: MFS transporter [Thermomicrobiales bacterium]|nr:MFS transporter [Thermomicrobiales bacterium]HRA48263.1 MFS transporter [Thermomicrobiales bacterium]